MTALVLSGGGLWALAGIGVAEALTDHGVTVDAYVGSSAGALVGALLALGHAPGELRRLAKTLTARDLKKPWRTWIRSLVEGRLPPALVSDERLFQRLYPYLAGKEWSSLQRPLWVVATSITNRHPQVFGVGSPVRLELGRRLDLGWRGQELDLKTALRASNAVPGLFAPVPLGAEWLVDGGVTDDYPLDVAAWMGAEQVIGVWVDEPHPLVMRPRWNAFHVLEASMTAMIRELSVVRQRQLSLPVTTVRLEMKGGHRVWERVTAIIDLGYQLASENIDALAELPNAHV
ncbi:patatin-like phospholipase family protein [Sulfobacillus harzensis]|uniref:Patatin n=1 Tax=Sulfobacillus harzensis TaxID=2729629 RepID=A0A7Y0L563_9FIRM|nr:patatin-like phospholipase family protein [Sulfobacillus harzensis]NMP22074.1 patatin [Sulfobacillus harzensis]